MTMMAHNKSSANYDKSSTTDSATQYLESVTRNESHYSCSSSTDGPIFLQPEQMYEQLIILAPTVNSSPSNNGCQSAEIANVEISDCPHNPIHDPPLFRLHSTSPNSLLGPRRYNEDFPGVANADRAAHNADWCSKELCVKMEDESRGLGINSSQSETGCCDLRTRGRTNTRPHGAHDKDRPLNASTQPWPRRELKRKSMYEPARACEAFVHCEQGAPSAANLATGTFINLTRSNDELDHGCGMKDGLTPEISRSHLRWCPIKRPCVEWSNNELTSPHLFESSFNNAASPLFEDTCVTAQFSPPDTCPGNYSDIVDDHPTSADRCPTSSESSLAVTLGNTYPEAFMANSSLTQPREEDSASHSSNSSSYIYGLSNLPSTFRNLSRLYLSSSVARPIRCSNTPNYGLEDSESYCLPRSSGGQLAYTANHEHNGPPRLPNGTPSHRGQGLASYDTYRRSNNPLAMNTFLRTYGLEEVHHRQAEQPSISSNSVRTHPFLRISDRNLMSPMLDLRQESPFTRPFSMYDYQGSVESVIQLALHLETSWRGVSPEELSHLPCHHYKDGDVTSCSLLKGQDKCMVCLDEFEDREHLRTLSCGHQYHVTCVDKWLKMNRTCPMCRSDAVLGSM